MKLQRELQPSQLVSVTLPIVLTLASVVLFVGLRVVLGNYRRAQNSRGSVRSET